METEYKVRLEIFEGPLDLLLYLIKRDELDIYDISLGAAADRSLVASDGLHPSGAQYARWVTRIAPAAAGLIRP